MVSPESDVPPPDPNQNDGYLVVLAPEAATGEWRAEAERDARGEEVASYCAGLRSAFPTADPLRYRGVQRYPIDRWWEGDTSGEDVPNLRARRLIHELYGPDPSLYWSQPPWFDADLLATIEVAREVLRLSDDASKREVVRVTRGAAASTADTLGFDVGYWGSDHFSAVADAVLLPRWHACPPEQLASVAPWVRRLNEHMLFRTAEDAMEYLRWYVEQPWAEEETEPGQFQVIRVDRAS